MSQELVHKDPNCKYKDTFTCPSCQRSLCYCRLGSDFMVCDDCATQAALKAPAFLPVIQNKIRLGKYSSWAADLSVDQIIAILWLIGEWSVRTDPEPVDPSLSKGERRAQTARNLLLQFRQRKMTLEEVTEAMREC